MLAGIVIALYGLLGQAPGADGSVEGVCRDYPERVAHLFDALDLNRAGLETAKAAAEAKQWPEACRALLEYYKTSPFAAQMRRTPKGDGKDRDADADVILNDTFTLYSVSAKVPRQPDGGLDWNFNGPSGDREWGWGLNRQQWFRTLLDAYEKTGNLRYAQGLDALIRDWVASNPYPGKKSDSPPWRGLEVFMRVAIAWPGVFYGLQDAPEFSPAARILMLSSVPDHADYNRHFHSERHNNWVTMEMRGLASAAVYWPEFKDANAWFDDSMGAMVPELTAQVYLDGAQKELTTSYHRVTMHSFMEYAKLAELAGRPVPPEFKACIERMINYLAYVMTPAGKAPMNNDSDDEPLAPEILEHADAFNHPDWTYIATHGEKGVAPSGPPSSVFPWAGQFVMRNGWDANAQWAFFDLGPLGIGHWHRDKLHLSVAAFGRDLLVDAGRYTYQSGPWRAYFTGTASHNTLLVDGHGQKIGAYAVDAPMSGNYVLLPAYDFARGVFSDSYEKVKDTVTHTRAVLYVRGAYWVVVDRIAATQPHAITALWHFHPECAVAADGRTVASTDEGKANLRIVPDPGMAWKLEIIRGRETPEPQGWYSRGYNLKEPSPCASYAARVSGPATFAWLLLPAKGSAPNASITIADSNDAECSLRVELPDGVTRSLRIPFKDGDVGAMIE
jgi:hypothetical protein